MQVLALVAGQGRLPAVVLGALRAEGRRVLTCALETSPPDAGIAVDRPFRLESLASDIDRLVAEGATEVAFAGAVRRPALDPARVDPATRPLMRRMAEALAQGDDRALRTLLGFFEERGLAVRAAHDLVPALLPPEGVLTAAAPGARDRQDAARAAAIVAALGAADVGQACVVAGGQALALEALPGTDAMLATLAPRPAGLPAGGLLYKAPKPGQDRRVDLPTIGPGTVRAAADAGLGGVVIEAGGVMLLDRAEAVAAADAAGLFLWVRPAGDPA
jgi:hypothetical protein